MTIIISVTYDISITNMRHDICIYIYVYNRAHTHIYIYMYIYIYTDGIYVNPGLGTV